MNTQDGTPADSAEADQNADMIASGADPVVTAWPQKARMLAEVMTRLIQVLEHETDLVHAHRNNEIASTAPEKQELAGALGRALADMIDVELEAEVRDALIDLDGKVREALMANENALGGGLQSFDRILKRAALHAAPKRQAPVGYGPSGAKPRASEGAGLSLLNGLKL